MKILLLGAAGQIGFELQRSLAPLGELTTATRTGTLPGAIDCLRADLGDADSLARALDSASCDIVVNAAGYTAVDRAEDEPQLAGRVNALALAQIGAWAKRHAALVVHYSTDYVFDGRGRRPYRENDPTAPLGVYGRSKLEGERALQTSGCDHLILRTAWVFGVRGSNFLGTMLRLASERDRLAIVDDQCGAPTSSRLIAAATAAILLRWAAADPTGRAQYQGIFHLSAAGETSWFGFACAIFERASRAGLIARLPEIAAIRSEDFPARARRPAYSVLATTKLRERFGLFLPDWTVGLDATIGELAEMRTGALK